MAKRSAVTTRVQPSAILELDGEKFTLVYDFNAIAEAEVISGCNLLHGISAALINTMSAAQLRGLLFAALQPNHPFVQATKDKPESGVSLMKAGKMIRIDTLPDIVKAITGAYMLSMPEKNENPPAAGAAPALQN